MKLVTRYFGDMLSRTNTFQDVYVVVTWCSLQHQVIIVREELETIYRTKSDSNMKAVYLQKEIALYRVGTNCWEILVNVA